MSCYEWEHAEIVLPSKEVPALKGAMTEFSNQLHEALYGLSRELHAQIKTRVPVKYRVEAERLVNELDEKHRAATNRSYSGPTRAAEIRSLALALVGEVLYRGASSYSTFKEMTVPTHEVIDHWVPRATNKTTTWPILGGDSGYRAATVSLSGPHCHLGRAGEQSRRR